jgi:hypothetical protein
LANLELATWRMKAVLAARHRGVMRIFGRSSLAVAEHRHGSQANLVEHRRLRAAWHPRHDPRRDQVAAVGLTARRAVRDAGLDLSGYCRGMFTADAASRRGA